MNTSRTFIMYRKEKVEVQVESTFQGVVDRMANVVAIDGYPFYSYDVQAQGKTFGTWMCNGYRVRADLVMVEPVETVETLTALAYGDCNLLNYGSWFGSKAWWNSIAPLPY